MNRYDDTCQTAYCTANSGCKIAAGSLTASPGSVLTPSEGCGIDTCGADQDQACFIPDDGFCEVSILLNNDGFCIKSDEFCTKNEDFRWCARRATEMTIADRAF